MTQWKVVGIYFFFTGSLLRLVFAKSLSCFSLIDFTICLEAPFRDDLGVSPRFAANAAPAAICCFFDFAGITFITVSGPDLGV